MKQLFVRSLIIVLCVILLLILAICFNINNSGTNLVYFLADVENKEQLQRDIINKMYVKYKTDQDVIDFLNNYNSLDIKNNYYPKSGLAMYEMDEFFFSLKHPKKDRFVAFFFSKEKEMGYLIRAAKYKGRWFFERTYRTTAINYTKEEFLKGILTDVNYFESRYTTKLNSNFWDDNWRMFDLLKSSDPDSSFDEIRQERFKKYGNIFEFIAIQLDKGELENIYF